MILYHYHAIWQSALGVITNVDGIVQLQNEIRTMEDYRKLKELVTSKGVAASDISICSLSILGTTNECRNAPFGWYFKFNTGSSQFTRNRIEADDIRRHLEPDEKETVLYGGRNG